MKLFKTIIITGLMFILPMSVLASHHNEAKKDIVDMAIGAGSFETLVTAVKAAGLVEALKGEGPFTVFAPTDEAFAKLPEGTVAALLKDKEQLAKILTYHVVPQSLPAKKVMATAATGTLSGESVLFSANEDGVFVDNAKVIKADIKTSNGIIHVIDSVILPKDVVDRAAGLDQFSTLVAAVKAAGLVETLKGDGPFTVMAPTNDAFAKLPKGTVATLLKPENKAKLTAILTYHVIPGKAMAKDVVTLDSAKTVQGQEAKIKVSNGHVYIDNAKVVVTDIVCTNGVIHVIDSVILPGSEGHTTE